MGMGFDGDDCSTGWVSLGSYEGTLCDAEARVGGFVTLSVDGGCFPSLPMLNPSVFLDVKLGSVPESVQFKTQRSDVLVLAEAVSPCHLGRFVTIAGRTYREEARVELLDNTVQNPTRLYHGDTVRRNPFNERLCRLESGCVAELHDVSLNLNTSVLQKLHDLLGRYVYKLQSLRTSVSPCGRLARWQEMDCAKEDCTPTELPNNVLQMLQAALSMQEGWLRNVFVDCQGVPPHAVIKLGSASSFRHVHNAENNVYDFTRWVGEHPGGADAIKQWASKGFELTFPWHHDTSRFERSETQKSLEFVGVFGEEKKYVDLPAALQSESIAAWISGGLRTSCSAFVEVCGSSGEVANVPVLGNQFAFVQLGRATFRMSGNAFRLDGTYSRVPSAGASRINLWVQMALRAKDQLRQRTAWALSQIFVVSLEGALSVRHPLHTEAFAHYYDIFVRNAFGNLRDVLHEVTYSPLMGDYLSSSGNSAFDHDNFYPDENYAREIMQLFTIGLWELKIDGSRMLDAAGDAIPTYDNSHIMNFARVFTGLSKDFRRSNIEVSWSAFNFIDPMVMNPDRHDAYPKPDLYGGYLGDNYPLCSDVPADAFLARGAKYVLLGTTYDGASDVMTLRRDSSLYSVLCGSDPLAESCNFMRPVVELQDAIPCFEEECNVLGMRVVKVSNAFFEFSPPKCVHLFFSTGQITSEGGDEFSKPWKRRCEDPAVPLAGTSCCIGCKDEPPPKWSTSCEDRPRANWTVLCQQEWWVQRGFCAETCWKKGYPYPGDDCTTSPYREKHVCSYPGEYVAFKDAEARCAAAGMTICRDQVTTNVCNHNSRVWTEEACSAQVAIHADGFVSSQVDERAKQNKVFVQWEKGYPKLDTCPAECSRGAALCVCPIQLTLTPLTRKAPSRRWLRRKAPSKMKIGAFPPSRKCDICEGTKTYFGTSGTYDEDTIFEINGKFYKNVAARVLVGGKAFRNPPTFLRRAALTEKAARDEVDSLLDHLFQHTNVPSFIAERLIQRFGISNPSPAYIRDVHVAFRDGKFGSKTYSGVYGDLAAAVAAVLLHDEARGVRYSNRRGSLREPLLKLIHFLRAMEFDDARHREVVFDSSLPSQFAQAPYWAPSVFNFYTPDYRPANFGAGTPAPEFEIFTPPNAMNFFNGMLSLIRYEGLTDCNLGFGVRARPRPCFQKSFMLSKPEKLFEVVEDLNVLLTGEQLSKHSRETVKAAYLSADEGFRFQAAQEATVMTPEFHVIGRSALEQLRPPEETVAMHNATSYKAMVLVFLKGGVDSFNLLVPVGCPLYDEYRVVRQNLKLGKSQLLEVSTAGQACSKFGVHYKLPFLKSLYDEEKAAFVSNVGALLKPLTKAQFESARRRGDACAGLFSHIDQSIGAQTLQCQLPGYEARGFGGRMADALTASGLQTTSFSVAGMATWAQGFNTSSRIIDAQRGAVRLQNFDRLAQVVNSITNYTYKNAYCEGYASQVADMIASSELLGKQLDSAEMQTNYVSSSQFDAQLRQVALLIASREARSAERDFFYVELGGFDNHDELLQSLASQFEVLDAALRKFVTELKRQNVFDNVVLVTSSDFGRSLTSNGKGTDHGWAGNYIVLGGAVQGGRVFNAFPKSLAEGGEQDAGRGRLIPKYPWENVMVPIAKWMGVQDESISTVFPNLGNFDPSTHIISTEALFSA
eukprot:TRINITY_DN1436_c0_g1_i1.p1 TRINITY_DN1436_c0_g1~~TRINITY_DN1436_c0_g1_i1.p1  ORF type:complete len:1935 (-),score=245.15 TRINITY_DN1436_c0_g1_i1:282-5306(-)